MRVWRAHWEHAPRHSVLFNEPAMTPLRQRMIREMELRRFAQRTVESYLAAVIALAAYYRCSPDELGLDEVRGYLHHLVADRKLAPGTCNLHAAAITFLFRQVLGQ